MQTTGRPKISSLTKGLGIKPLAEVQEVASSARGSLWVQPYLYFAWFTGKLRPSNCEHLILYV